MSLQVWLPLNGNLNNQGLSEVTVTNSGATVDSNGKIGSCYSFDGNDDFISLTSSSLYSTIKGGSLPFSITTWAYRADTTRAILFGDYTLSGSIDFNLEFTTSNKVRFYWRADPDLVFDNAVVATSKWSHIAVTYDGSTIKCYIDGVFAQSSTVTLVTRDKTSGSYYLGRDARTGTTAFNGRMNDFRLYDHCLSAKEVKEISKGLIGHWKLDNNGFGNPNLINTDNPLQAGGRTVVTDKKLIISATDTTADTYFTIKLAEAIQADVEYTLSCGVEDMNCNTNWNFPLFAQGNPISKTLVISPNASKASITFTVPTGSSYVGTTIIFMDDGGRPSTNPNDITLSNFKLEKGSVATHWCPHTSDNMYTLLGLDSSAEVDCSGLSNNGTKIGGLTPSTSPVSIRYESCYDFDGNTGSIQIPNLATLAPSGEFTMNCWIYHDDTWSSKGYETILGGPNNTFELEAKVTSTNSPVLYAYSWGQGKATYELNKWNMITMTRNASESKFYINGELKITGTAGTIPPGNYFMGAWRSSSEQNYKGKISDFRLYSNVLSVEDIQELYNTSASVDKNGNMYAYEFKEE